MSHSGHTRNWQHERIYAIAASAIAGGQPIAPADVHRGVSWSSSNANLCSTATSRSPDWAARRIASASNLTWVVLTGSGSAATAWSSAADMDSTASGENAALEKSLIGAGLPLVAKNNQPTVRRLVPSVLKKAA
jgi:hypothetical protein